MNYKMLVLSATLLLTTTGCEELQQFLPTVRFERMDLSNLDFAAADVEFVFQVDNPNPIDIRLASFNYDLGLEQISLISGDDPDGFELSASSASELRLPVHLDYTDAWDAVSATRGQDFVQFGMKGEFGFNTDLGLIELPYNESGEFPALRIPKFEMKQLQVANINPLTATIELHLDVDNEHESNLFFENLVYDITLAGQRVGTGTITPFEVNGDFKKTLVIPFTVDLLTSAFTIVDAIVSKKPLDAGLNIDMEVLVPFLDETVALSINETGNLAIQ